MTRLAARLAPVLLLVIASIAPAAAAPPPFGGLTELPGCLSGNGSGVACAVGTAISADGYPESAMSPDGRNVYLTASNDDAVSTLAIDNVTGAVGQLLATAGCVSKTGTGGQCATSSTLTSPAGATVSPDGRNVYVGMADNVAGGVAVFARGNASGALTPLPGEAACINQNGSGGCAPGNGLSHARSVAISPDGHNVYVAADSDNAVAVFSRDPATGALTQLVGSAGCLTSGTAVGCGPAKGLTGAWSVDVSPDGKDVYVMSDGHSIAVFSRNTGTGALTQLGGPDGCVSTTGDSGMCATNSLIQRPRAAAFSSDGADMYVADLSTGVIAFARNGGGALTQLPGQGGCATQTGSGGACGVGPALTNASGVAVSPDGRSVYVASIDPTNAVSALSRDPANGAISPLSGQGACVSEDGTGGVCADGVALTSATWPGVTPDGAHLLVTGTGDSGDIASFNREVPPVCSSFSQTVGSGGATRLALPCNDPNGDPITRSIIGPPTHGVLDQSSLLYTPNLGFAGSDSVRFTASDGTLTSAPASGSLTVRDTVAPVISRASISPRRFAAAAAAGAAHVKRGAVVRYRLSEAGTVTITVQRARPGRRVGRRCRPLTRKRSRGKRCTRYVRVGRLTQKGAAGANRKAFSGRLRRKALKPGAYRVVLQAVDAAHNRSKVRRVGFRIVRAA